MKYPSWDEFEKKYGKNEAHDQFENLCRLLFCRELGIEPRCLVAVKNQAGNETKVVFHHGKLYGFQCKYFDYKYDFKQFKDSIFIAKKNNKDQDVIYLYSNKKFPSPESETNLKNYVSGLGMEWQPRFDNQITDDVAKQENQDIYNFFFRSVQIDREVFSSYESVLNVDVNMISLDVASEKLIKDGKYHKNFININKVKHYLNDKKFCLIKAPEGRGKTFLSMIIAYHYHHTEKMKVYFLDFKGKKENPINDIKNEMLNWHKYTQNEYLLVFENVHAYEELNQLMKLIKDWINKLDGNRFRFLLNARPADVDFESFSEWEEIVKLIPGNDDVKGIIDLFSEDVGRAPFANDSERDHFLIKNIYPKNEEESGVNLRLLKIYLETWQNNPEIQYVSDVRKENVINEFKKLYLENRSKEEIDALWYISSLFQFDVPLCEDFVSNIGNLVKHGLLRFEGNRFHLPHSVDASFLYKAICAYKHKNCDDKMIFFADNFLKEIIASDNPKYYESDFRLLISGLLEKKTDYKKAIHYLVKEENAKDVIEKLFPGFVLKFFRPENHEQSNAEALMNYYHQNKVWLIPKIQELSPGALCLVKKTFENHLKYDIVKDVFKSPKDLDDYLSIDYNYKVLIYRELISSLANPDDGYKTILIEHYKKNKAFLKLLVLEFGPARLNFYYITYKNQLKYDIVKDIFETPEDLDGYLSIDLNYKVLIYHELIKSIVEFDNGYKTILKKHFRKNKTSLKPLLFGLSPTSLSFVYPTIKKHLNYDIIKDIFKNTKGLVYYLGANENYKVFINTNLLKPIIQLNAGYKSILIEHYKKNKAILKPLLLKLSPERLTFVYLVHKNHLNYDIVNDIFEDTNDLDGYLRCDDGKMFQQDDVFRSIELLSDEHKQVLVNSNAYKYFFYPTKSTNNSRRISQGYIYQFWSKKKNFDVCCIKNNCFYLDGVSWAYMHKLVYIIKESMTDTNKSQSINMVKALIEMVFAKENALSYATSDDLSYFYSNISSINDSIFKELMYNNLVIEDIKRRLKAPSYSAGDLYLFDLFFSIPWCQTELIPKILNADNAQKEIIKNWHDKLVKKLKDREDEITSGTLLDYIHRNPNYVVTKRSYREPIV